MGTSHMERNIDVTDLMRASMWADQMNSTR